MGRQAASVIGGRFVTGIGAASSPPRGRWPNGRYQTSVGLAASESPISSALWGRSELVSVSKATSGAWRSRWASAGRSAGSSMMMTLGAP